jgi:hypothetical protein
MKNNANFIIIKQYLGFNILYFLLPIFDAGNVLSRDRSAAQKLSVERPKISLLM